MRAVGATAAALAALVLLAGCTSSDDEPSSASAPAETASAQPSSSPADEVDPADLSRDLLASAAAADGALEPIGSQTLEVDRFVEGTMTVVVDVLRLERRDDSTLVTLALSSPTDPVEGAAPYGTVFEDGSAGKYFDRIALEDTAAGVRHYPLSWRRQVKRDLSPPDPGPLNACVCMFRQNLHLGAEPVVMDALYGPLPDDVDTVTLVAPDGLSIAGLEVAAG